MNRQVSVTYADGGVVSYAYTLGGRMQSTTSERGFQTILEYNELGRTETVTNAVGEKTGYTYDEILELYFAQNRLYDPKLHRFTQQDPIKDGENWYVYCGSNPIIYTDVLSQKYFLAEGQIAHLFITAYVQSQDSNTIADTVMFGLTRTKSGRGRPDIVIEQDNVYHVYEIKSDEYMSRSRYQTAAYHQLSSYIDALRNFDKLNEEKYPLAKTAQAGTILNWNHIVLPYIADANKVIETWTDKSYVGMIFYKIRKLNKKKDEAKSSSFVKEKVRERINYYATLCCDYAPNSSENLIFVDTYADKELNEDIISWLKNVKLIYKAHQDSAVPYLEFPDKKVCYYQGSSMYYNYISKPAYKDLLSIHANKSSNWNTKYPNDAGSPVGPVLPTQGVPLPTVPVPVPVPVLP